ncbi:MAG: response regulator [Hyphomonadaceae bacterium]|nr:response regulator [Hyphomonadaceae bacterium]
MHEKIGESSLYMLMIIIYITVIIWVGGYAVYAVSWFLASSIMVGVLYFYTKHRKPRELSVDNVDQFLKGHVAISSITGAVWGSLVIYFIDFTSSFSLVAASAIVFAIALSGLMPGATYRPSYIGQTTSMLVPFSGYILLFAEGGFRIAGVGVVILYITGVISSIRAQRVTDESIFLGQLRELNAKVRGQNEEIKRTNEEKTRFLAATSHDFSQPLHAQGYFIQALEQHLDKPEQKTLLKKIEASWQHQKRLLNGLVEINQLESGTIVPKIKVINIADQFQSFVDEFEFTAKDKSIEFIVDLQPACVESDPLLLTRIVQNLLTNAFRYTPENGEVKLSVNQFGDDVEISIQDNGQGIPRDKQSQIFDEYVQLQSKTLHGEQIGLGLGLSIVKRLSKLLKVEIVLVSEPNQGTEFKLVLPASKRDIDPSQLPIMGHNNIGDRLIILVDDEKDIRQSMSNLLEQQGYQLIIAATPAEAMTGLAAHENIPDLLIIDKRLADDESGIDLIRDLREEVNEDIPAILMSGDLSTPQEGIPLDNVQFLGKPIGPGQLQRTIIDLLRQDVSV